MTTVVAPPLRLDWSTFGRAVRELATDVLESGWVPDVVVSIPRRGLFTAGGLALALDVRDVQVLPPGDGPGPRLPEVAAGCRVLVTDDYTDSGATLDRARSLLAAAGAEVRLAVLVERPHSSVWCHYAWRTTDVEVSYPWSPLAPVSF